MKAKIAEKGFVYLFLLVIVFMSASVCFGGDHGDTYVTYQLPQQSLASTEYNVSIKAGTGLGTFSALPCEGYRHVNYAHFSFSGTVTLKISLSSGGVINSYSLGPNSYTDVSHSRVDSNTAIEVTIKRPCKLFLHNVNGGTSPAYNEPVLWIYGDPIEDNPPASSGTGIINVVSDRGADNTGANDVTNILNQALVDSGANSSIVYVPAGLYKVCGGTLREITMRSNSKLYLAGGARLRCGNYNTGAQPSSVIRFLDATNAKVFGRGSVDGNGVWIHYGGPGWSFPALTAGYADNSSVEGIIIQNPSMFTVHLINCDNFKMTNVKTVDYENEDLALYGGNDGVDLNSCQNCTIDDCAIYAGDDTTSLKCSYSNRWTTVSGNTYRNCVLVGAAAGSAFNITDFRGGMTLNNTCFENCDSIQSQWGIFNRFIYAGYGGENSLTNVYYKNLRLEPRVANHAWHAFLTNLAENGTMNGLRYWNIQAPAWGSYGLMDPATNPYGNGFDGCSSSNWILNTTLDNVYVNGSGLVDFTNLYANYSGVTFPYTEPVVVTVSATTRYAVWGGTTAAGTAGVFTFTRTGPTTDALAIPYTIKGSAVNGTDYTTIADSITVNAGSTTATRTILPFSTGTGMKTIELILGNAPTGMTWMAGTPHTAQVTIRPNMVVNPGAEVSGGWRLSPSKGRRSGPNASFQTSNVYSGARSLKLGPSDSGSYAYQYMPVVAGADYVLSLWGRVDDIRAVGQIRVYYYYNTTYLGQDSTVLSFNGTSYSQQRMMFTVPITLGGYTPNKICIYVSKYSAKPANTGNFYVDDVCLFRNLCVNPGMELTTGWTLTDVSFQTTNVYSGAKSLKAGPSDTGSYGYQDIPAVAGANYVLSLWGKVDDTRAVGLVRVYYLYDTTWLGQDTAVLSFNTTSYAHQAVQVKVPSTLGGYTPNTIRIIVSKYSSPENTGNFYTDEVCLYK